MKLQDRPPVHLTYCLNVHTGETWEENLTAIREYTLRVRDIVCPRAPFGLGLRLSYAAAVTLADPRRRTEFREFCDANGLYVLTVNGFPYGRFHGRPVKSGVYRPDWREPERLAYTNRLTEILAALLPEGVNGAISTVPGGYRAEIKTDTDAESRIAGNLAASAAHAADVFSRTGRLISIALEPEPDCLLGTVDETIAFFHGPLREFGIAFLRRIRGLSAADAAALLDRHLGVCYDTVHMAVEFEDLAEGLERLRAAKVSVRKVHLGAALSLRQGAVAQRALREFCEPVYLHQTRRQKNDGKIERFSDLTDALADPSPPDARWRVHFHLPLFFESVGDLQSTRGVLTPRFFQLLCSGMTEQLEIETYTYHVLPSALAIDDVSEAIAREYQWVLQQNKC